MEKNADAYRTISEAAEELKLPQHVLRFWETRFLQLKPLKRGGGRRFYRPEDMDLLRAIKTLLYGDGYTIKGVQRILKEQGPRAVASLARSGGISLRGAAGWAASADRDVTAAIPEAPPLAEVGEPPPGPLGVEPGGVADTGADRRPVESPSEAVAACLRTVLFELSECERVLAAARS